MNGGCKVCGYAGDELNTGHIEHAHAVARVSVRRLAEQEERHKRAIAVLTGQKKNRMLLGLTREVTRLREELAQERNAIQLSTERQRAPTLAAPGGEG